MASRSQDLPRSTTPDPKNRLSGPTVLEPKDHPFLGQTGYHQMPAQCRDLGWTWEHRGPRPDTCSQGPNSTRSQQATPTPLQDVAKPQQGLASLTSAVRALLPLQPPLLPSLWHCVSATLPCLLLQVHVFYFFRGLVYTVPSI